MKKRKIDIIGHYIAHQSLHFKKSLKKAYALGPKLVVPSDTTLHLNIL